MRRWWKVVLGLALAAGVALLATWLVPVVRQSAVGWWRGEASYRGRYTNAWADEFRGFEPVRWLYHAGIFRPEIPNGLEREEPPSLFGNGRSRCCWIIAPPLWEGDPESVPVLLGLLRDPDRRLRVIAAKGLGNVGPDARDAVPALLRRAADDPDAQVRVVAAWALHRIDQQAATA